MQGVTAVAIGYAVIFLLYLPRTLQIFLRPVGASFRDYFAAIAIPLAVSCGLAGVHVAATNLLPLAPWAEIGLAVSEIFIGYGLTAWALRGRLSDDLDTVRRLFKARMADATPEAARMLQNTGG
jgi:hypothetical protein